MKIDSHQHFWQFNPVSHGWIDDSMQAIQRDFLPADLKPLLHKNDFDGCVVVQTDQSHAENEFLLKLAGENDFIKGVVGWVDLQSADIDSALKHYSQYPKLKGFRHVLQAETNRSLMLTPAFMNGISALKSYNYTYDILIYPDQLIYIPEFVKAFPGQKFVIDHIAKPYIKKKEIADWAKGIKAVAQYENVYCKVSGMVTEADWHNWQHDDFTPYLNVIFEAFGTKRLMFGSDWPVCNIAGGYDKAMDIVKSYTSQLSPDEQAGFWGDNAMEFYDL